MVALAGLLLGPEGFLPGAIEIVGRRIVRVEWGAAAADRVGGPLLEHFIGPGFMDLQLNGGFGKDFNRSPSSAVEVARALPSTGVTAFLATLISAPQLELLESVETLAGVAQRNVSGARILGVHLEGPFISPERLGAHDASAVRPPSLKEMRRILDAGGGAVRIVALAPELPGALSLVELLLEEGVIASAGHSNATYEEAMRGFDAGVSWVNHLFNAQAELHHRSPGLAGAALVRDGLTVGLIADGIHVHPAMCKLAYRSKGLLISLATDGCAAMGSPAGEYRLGGKLIRSDGLSARTEEGALAGSVLTMDRAVANFARLAGAGIDDAWRMASEIPARLLGRRDLGVLREGALADLVVLSPEMEVELTLKGGRVAYAKEALDAYWQGLGLKEEDQASSSSPL